MFSRPRRKREFISDEIERDWLAEIAHRSDEIDAGTAELVDWSEVRQKIARWTDRG